MASGPTSQVNDWETVAEDWENVPSDNAVAEAAAKRAGSAPSRFMQGATSEVFGSRNQPLSPQAESGSTFKPSYSDNPQIAEAEANAGAAQMLFGPTLKNTIGQAQSGNWAGATGALLALLGTLGGSTGASKGISKGVKSVRNIFKEAGAAREFIAGAPEIRLANQSIATELKAGNARTIAELRAGRTQAGIQESADIKEATRATREATVNPLEQQQRDLMNLRTQQSAALNQERKAVQTGTRDQLSFLNVQMAKSKQAALEQATTNAKLFTESLGKEMTEIEIAQGTQAARAHGWRKATDEVSKLYDGVRDIFKKNVIQIGTGQKNEAGEEIMRTVTGPVDMTGVKAELREFYDRFKNDIGVARQNQSPGASAVMQIMEGPNIVDGAVAIDNLKALNRLGYNRADAVIREPSEAIARKAGETYRTALRESVEQMDGGEEALGMLDEAKILLRDRDTLYRTGDIIKDRPLARRAAEAIQESGKVVNLARQPIKFRAYWNQVQDTPVAQGVVRQVMEDVFTGKDVLKRWSDIPAEVKNLMLTPEQISNVDKIILQGKPAIEKIASESIAANNTIIKEASAKLNQIGKSQADIGNITVNARNLRGDITKARQSIMTQQAQQVTALESKMAQTSFNIGKTQRELSIEVGKLQQRQRLQLAQQIKDANAKIEKAKKAKKILLAVGTVAGITAFTKLKFAQIGNLIGGW
jgi:hypothetical protein